MNIQGAYMECMNNTLSAHLFNTIFVHVAQIFQFFSVFILNKTTQIYSLGSSIPELFCWFLVGA